MAVSGKIPFEQILSAVAREAGVSTSSIVEAAETPGGRDCWPRQRVCMLARRLRPDLACTWIGRRLGGRHHTTVLSAAAAGERRFETDPAEQQAVREILERLGVDALPERSAPSWRRPTPGEHVCETCQGAAVFGQGRTWFCVRCVPADFLPIERRAS